MSHRRPLSSHNLPTAFWLLLTAFCFLPSVEAQSTSATLSVTVEDLNGAVVPGVEVTILNVETSAKRQATTNELGSLAIPFLPPGHYTVTARRQGFAPVEVPNLVLNVGDLKSLKIQLKPGSISEMVKIDDNAPLINESPAVGTVVDRRFVGNLPLNGRSFQSLILLTPGVTVTRSNNSSTPGQFSVNGQRGNANYFTVDGVSANIGASSANSITRFSQEQAGALPGFTALGSTSNLVSIDALEEFRIQTSSYAAEFGRQPGGQIQLVTRSGGNQFHGTAFEYVRNEAFDANDWFANSSGLKRAPLRQQQFGGTFTGPMMLPRFGEGGKTYLSGRNKSFFFFSYEGLRLLLPVVGTFHIASLRLRELAPASMKPFVNMFPLPTGPETLSNGVPSGLAPFVGSYSSPSSLDATSIRVDHTFNGSLTVFGRYNHAPSKNLTRLLSFLRGEHNLTRTLTLGSTLALNPRLTNDLRFNISTNRSKYTLSMDNFGGAKVIDPAVLVSGYSGPGPSLGWNDLILPGAEVGPALGDLADSYQRQINVVDNVAIIKDVHQIKFGVDYRRLAPIYGPVAYVQDTVFRSEADVLNATASIVVISANRGARPLFNNFSAYVQDTWKVSRRLNVNLGVRWELNPAPHDRNGLKPVLVVGAENLPTATLAPANAELYKTYYRAFAPRFGVTYQLNQASGRETILRGGAGVYYDLGSGQASVGFGGFPFSVDKVLRNVPVPLSPSLAMPPTFPAVTLPTSQTLYSLNPNLQLPYTLEWNAALEQSLGTNQAVSISYVASAARRLLTTQRVNQRVGGTGPRPNANFGQINYISNGPKSDYQSLQVQFRRRLSHGLQSVVNYTWSHATDEVSNEVDFGTLVRGNADFDVPHNFNEAVTYDLPKFRSGPILRSLFGNWSIDSSLYLQSGPPMDLFAGFNIREDGTQVNVRPDVVAGVPFWIRDPLVPSGRRINRAAFSLPPKVPGTSFFSRQGTLGRNVVRLPGIYQVNFALRRQFNIGEKVKLQFKVETFNLLNHPLFGQYDNHVQFSNFGIAQTTLNANLGGLNSLYQLGGPRSMQFSLRLTF
jgi:hypothetical protein